MKRREYFSPLFFTFLEPRVYRNNLSTPQKVGVRFTYILSSPDSTYGISLGIMLYFSHLPLHASTISILYEIDTRYFSQKVRVLTLTELMFSCLEAFILIEDQL